MYRASTKDQRESIKWDQWVVSRIRDKLHLNNKDSNNNNQEETSNNLVIVDPQWRLLAKEDLDNSNNPETRTPTIDKTSSQDLPESAALAPKL